MGSPTIMQVIEWSKDRHLNLDVAFQREAGVWSPSDKKELITSILNELPIPELLLHYRSDPKKRYVYDVIDGKQRLTTILSYAKNQFPARVDFDDAPKEAKSYKELPQEKRDIFNEYTIRFFELKDLTIEKLSEIFVRINRTGKRLTRQEIRNAKYKGAFIMLAKKLCEKGRTANFLTKHKIIAQETKKRMGDIELTCELLAYLLKGVQDKKKTLDTIIGENEKLKHKEKLQARYVRTVNLIQRILPDLREVRYHQKSDFYSLFGAISDLDKDEYNLENPKYQKLARLVLVNLSNELDRYKTTKDTKNNDIVVYYDSTQQGTDTKDARTKRIDYLKNLLASVIVKKDKQRGFTDEQRRLLWNAAGRRRCKLCDELIESWDDLEVDHKKPWALAGASELKNGQLAHGACNRSKGKGRAIKTKRRKKR